MSAIEGANGVGGASSTGTSDASGDEFQKKLGEMAASALFQFAMQPIQEANEELDKDEE